LQSSAETLEQKLVQGLDPHAKASLGIVVWAARGESLGDGLELSIYGIQADAFLDVSHQRHDAFGVRCDGHREIDIRVVPRKAWRHHAEDCIRLTIELNCATGDGRVRIEV